MRWKTDELPGWFRAENDAVPNVSTGGAILQQQMKPLYEESSTENEHPDTM